MTSRTHPAMFEDVPVIGELPREAAVTQLRQLGDVQTATEISQPVTTRRGLGDIFDWGGTKPWRYATHQFGYVPPLAPGTGGPVQVLYPGAITADDSLRNGRINIHLNRLRVFDYPGGGQHQVLFTFRAQNQVAGSPETVSFSQTYRVPEGQTAGVIGYPIFIGLNVGNLGAAFQGFTVNVKNFTDQAFLDLLDSPSFQAGLNLLTGIQPVIKPFTDMTLGIAHMLAKRNENVAVQDFYLGLDFTESAFGVRLAEGDYIAVQAPSETAINWDEWIFQPSIGALVNRDQPAATLPYNYVVFGVTRYLEP